MIWSFLTVASYTITAFGDKYIAAKLKCRPAEYILIVSAATVLWLLFLLPFTGWKFNICSTSLILLSFLIIWKLMELFTTSILLKFMEPYELKVWLGINIILSYFYNVYNGKNTLRADMVILGIFLLSGIYIIVTDTSASKKSILKTIPVCIFYILSNRTWQFCNNLNNCTVSNIHYTAASAKHQKPYIQKRIPAGMCHKNPQRHRFTYRSICRHSQPVLLCTYTAPAASYTFYCRAIQRHWHVCKEKNRKHYLHYMCVHYDYLFRINP